MMEEILSESPCVGFSKISPSSYGLFFEAALEKQVDVQKWLSWLFAGALVQQQAPSSSTPLEDPLKVLEIHEKDAPQRVCPTAFADGELAWSCKTCQVDETCIFCSYCFQNSNHQGHEVTFHHSNSSGCCDCGDPDAWDSKGFCSKHGSDLDPIAHLPPCIQQNGPLLMRAVVSFISAHSKAISQLFNIRALDSMNESEQVQLILHNDDVHTFDEVISTLTQNLRVPSSRGHQMASEVHNNGHSVAMVDYPRFIREKWKSMLSSGLLFSVWDSQTTRMFKFLEDMVEWIYSVSRISDGTSRIVSDALLTCQSAEEQGTSSSSPQPPLSASSFSSSSAAAATTTATTPTRTPTRTESTSDEDSRLVHSYLANLLSVDCYLHKRLVSLLHVLYLRLLVDAVFKEGFATCYALIHGDLVRKFVQHIGPEDSAVFSLSVQFLNRKSYVLRLEQKHHFMRNLLALLLEVLGKTLVPHRSGSVVNAMNRVMTSRRWIPLIRDIKYCLKAARGSIQLGADFFKVWTEILKIAQGMYPQKKMKHLHVEYETREWEHSFDFSLQLSLCFEYMSAMIWGSPPDTVDEFLQHTVASIVDWNRMHLVSVTNFDQKLTFKHMENPSFHLNLNRFFALIVMGIVKRTRKSPKEILRKFFDTDEEFADFADTVLHCHLDVVFMAAEVDHGLWKRNGSSIVSSVTAYDCLPFTVLFRDLDLLAVQMCVLLHTDPQQLISVTLQRFGVMYFLQGMTLSDPASTLVCSGLAEEALCFLIQMITYLPLYADGDDFSTFSSVEMEILHVLAERDQPFSKIDTAVSRTRNSTFSRQELDAAIRKVATRNSSSDGQNAGADKFSLKLEFMHEYNPCFPHLSHSQHQAAMEHRSSMIKPDKKCPIVTPPTPLGMDNQVFLCIRDLAICPDLIQILAELLNAALTDSVQSKTKLRIESVALIARVVHVITLGLWVARIELPMDLDRFVQSLITAPEGRSNNTKLEGSSVDHGEGANVDSSADKDMVDVPPLAQQRYHHHHPVELQENSVIGCLLKIESLPQWKEIKGSVSWLLDQMSVHSPVCLSAIQSTERTDSEEEEKKKKLERNRMMALAEMANASKAFQMQLDSGEFDDEEDLLDDSDENRKLPECIVCRERTDDVMGLVAHGQLSKVLQSTVKSSELFLRTCGHSIHLSCFDISFAASLGQHTDHLSLQSEKGEFQCPLCKCLSNLMIPIIPASFSASSVSSPKDTVMTECTWDPSEDIKWVRGDLCSSYKKHAKKQLIRDEKAASDDEDEDEDEDDDDDDDDDVEGGVNCDFNVGRKHRTQAQDFAKRLAEIVTDSPVTNRDIYLQWAHRTVGYTFESILADKGCEAAAESEQNTFRFWGNVLRALKIGGISSMHSVVLRAVCGDYDGMYSSEDRKADDKGLSVRSAGEYPLLLTVPSDLITCMFLSPGVSSKLEDLQRVTRICWMVRVMQTIAALPVPGEVEEQEQEQEQEDNNNNASQKTVITQAVQRLMEKVVRMKPSSISWRKWMKQLEDYSDSTLQLCYLQAKAIAAENLVDPSATSSQGQLSPTQIRLWCGLPSSFGQSLFEMLSRSGQLPLVAWMEEVPIEKLVEAKTLFEIPMVRPLIELPLTYADAHMQLTKSMAPRDAALCLICGVQLNINSRGDCTKHAVRCAAGVGIVFMVDQCQLLLLRPHGAIYYVAPYLDDFGESFRTFQTAPLILRSSRYDVVRKLWSSHGIAREIVKTRTSIPRVIRVGWF